MIAIGFERDRSRPGRGMLRDVVDEFPGDLKQHDREFLRDVHRGCGVLERKGDAEALRRVRREPFQRRCQALAIEQRRTELELQRVQLVERFAHQAETVAQARGRPRIDLAAGGAELQLCERQLLHRAVVQLAGQPPALALFDLRQFLGQTLQARVRAVQTERALGKHKQQDQQGPAEDHPQQRVVQAVLVSDRDPVTVDGIALGGRDRVDALLQDPGEHRPIATHSHRDPVDERRLAGHPDLRETRLADVVARGHEVADESIRTAIRDRLQGRLRVGDRKQLQAGPVLPQPLFHDLPAHDGYDLPLQPFRPSDVGDIGRREDRRRERQIGLREVRMPFPRWRPGERRQHVELPLLEQPQRVRPGVDPRRSRNARRASCPAARDRQATFPARRQPRR